MVQVQIIDAEADATVEASLGAADVVILHGCSGRDRSFQDLALRLAAHRTVVVLFPTNDPPDVDRLLSAGVAATLPQSMPVNDLVPALTAAFHRTERPSPWSPPGDDLPALSRREHEVLGLIANGLTHHQIARRLKISIHTVDTYVRRIKDKWKLGNKADLTRAAMPTLHAALPALRQPTTA